MVPLDWTLFCAGLDGFGMVPRSARAEKETPSKVTQRDRPGETTWKRRRKLVEMKEQGNNASEEPADDQRKRQASGSTKDQSNGVLRPSRIPMRGLFMVIVLGVGLLAGCAMNSRRSMAGFALSTPSHNHDWDWLQSALKAEGDLHTHFWLALPIIGRLLI